jgi:hypothetical protein
MVFALGMDDGLWMMDDGVLLCESARVPGEGDGEWGFTPQPYEVAMRAGCLLFVYL